MLSIGIDLGTSSVKLLLMNEAGRILHTVSRDYPVSYPHPGWSEQDPADWYRETLEGLKEIAAKADGDTVRGISFGGQMHGLVILDDKDNVIRPVILWNDGRTGEETGYLNREIGQDKLTSYTANIAFAGFTAPKLLWLKKHEPEHFARIRKIMLPKDYLAYRFSGTFCTDYSDASGTLLLDVKERRWSAEMMRICDVAEEQLPKLYESFEQVGTLKREIAEETGLSPDVAIVAGAGDNAAAAIGTGTVGEGACNISLGTSGTIFLSSDRFRAVPSGALHAFDHADGRFHLLGCMLSAASCNKWWMDDILADSGYDAMQAQMKRLGENRVYFLPYLMGERSPHNDPDARGVFFGMTMDTTRVDLSQAVLEGVMFAHRDMYEVARESGIRPARTMICGGGSKSRLWRRLAANILDLPVDVPVCEEGPAMGAAMLALTACGAFRNIDEACRAVVRVRETVEPEETLVRQYEEHYQKFRTLYPAMKPLFRS